LRRRATRLLIAALLFVAVSPTRGDARQDSSPSKSQYNLFHRTPRDLRRPLTTDRPDRTESPYTVDAGLFQVEIDVFTYGVDASEDGQPGVAGNSYAVMPFNMKAGLLHNVDLQVVLETWAWKQENINGVVERQRGLGAVSVRTKVNLWGNDAGRTAFAVMPYVAFVADPGSPRRVVNAGVVLPLRVDLGAGWGIGTMLQFEVAHDVADAPRKVAMIGSASIGRSITGPLSFFVELYGGTVLADETSAWEGTGDVGLTLGIGPNVQVDAGVNLGFTRLAEDVHPFLGLSVRF
jgi:hypothetical protein